MELDFNLFNPSGKLIASFDDIEEAVMFAGTCAEGSTIRQSHGSQSILWTVGEYAGSEDTILSIIAGRV